MLSSSAKSRNSSNVAESPEILKRRELIRGRVAPVASVEPGCANRLVSIVVVTFNGSRTLGRCLQALRCQSHSHIEVIVLDNGSTDNSSEIVTELSEDSRFHLVRSEVNLGIAGGRNLAVTYTKGEVVAFIDDDGFADPYWVENLLQYFFAPEQIEQNVGAVASLVFFDDKKLTVNGAGGGINLQGYAGDFAFNSSLGEATLRTDITFPMGCGMAIQRQLLKVVFPLDTASLRWYDDVEVGVRVWRVGYRVRLAPNAIVDHVFHSSLNASANPNWLKAWQFERCRIRHVLKYKPRRELIRWGWEELRLHFSLRRPRHLILGILSWGWNLIHGLSTLKIRNEYRKTLGSLPAPEENSWGEWHS